MKGVFANLVDANGKKIYSGQRMALKNPDPGELNLDLPVSWSKYSGFQFAGRRLTPYIAEKYVIVSDISSWDKIKPKFV